MSNRVVFGEGETRWSAPNPESEVYARASHEARYPPHDRAPAYYVAELAEVYGYLVSQCPTTKEACEKLALIRAAVRKARP